MGTRSDFCGAGHSFTAGGALVLHLTGDPVLAAQVGNLVAFVTITKPGHWHRNSRRGPRGSR